MGHDHIERGRARPGGAARGARLALGGALLSCSLAAWPLDLLQAYQAARAQDAGILASRAAAIAGRERVPQALAQLLPNVAVSAGLSQNQLNSTGENFLGFEQNSRSRYVSGNAALTLRQPLVRSYQLAQYRQARAQVEDGDAALAQDEQNLAVRVADSYFEALLTHQQLELVLAQRQVCLTQLDAARKAFAAGSGTRTEIDEAQARLDMTAALEIEARQNVEYTRRQLQALVNEPIDRLAAIDVARLELRPPQPDNVDAWIERAERSSPQLQSLRAQQQAAELELDKARAGYHPTLDAVAQWTRSSSENITSPSSRYTNGVVGVQLNVPLYTGGAVDSGVRQARAARERADHALQAGRRELGLRVHKEYRSITESAARVRALEQAVRSAEQMVLSNRKSLQAGSRTVVDVLNAEQQRMLALRDLAQARCLYLASNIRLLALVGAADAQAVAAVNLMLQR